MRKKSTIVKFDEILDSSKGESFEVDVDYYFDGEKEIYRTRDYCVRIIHLNDFYDNRNNLDAILRDIPLKKNYEDLDILEIEFCRNIADYEKKNSETTKDDVLQLIKILNTVISVLKKKINKSTILVYSTNKGRKKLKKLYELLIDKFYPYDYKKFYPSDPDSNMFDLTVIVPKDLLKR